MTNRTSGENLIKCRMSLARAASLRKHMRLDRGGDGCRSGDLSAAQQHGAQRTTAEKVHMQVENFLAAVFIAVDQQAISVSGNAFCGRDLAGGGKHFTDQLFVFFLNIVDGGDFPVGNNQDMDRRLGSISRKAVTCSS